MYYYVFKNDYLRRWMIFSSLNGDFEHLIIILSKEQSVFWFFLSLYKR